MSYDYSYDANGNITEIKQNGKLINKYTYDSLNELKEEYDYVNKFYINYSYDGAGNLQNKYEQVLDPTYGYPTGTQHGNTYEYTDTSWKDKLTKVNGSNISYDANGNPLTYRDGMSFEWENGRILKKINTSDKSVQMSYDSNGMRTQKTVDGVKTNYYYDSNKNLIALVKGNDTLLFYYDSDGSATSFSYNGTMYFYVKNLQGDVIRIIDLAGTEVASYVYDAWGNIKDTKGEPTIREINPIRYRGYVYDTETSLYYLQSRYYDPFTGRFLNADVYADTQSGTPLSTNMFAYCENNAINKSDDEGKDAWWIQSPNSANGKGHTSLLLKEKSGYWWYFYWGPSSIQLLFLGTTSLKNININVRNQINYYNNDKKRPVMIRKLDYSENYTQAIQLKGHFEDSIKRIKKFINDNKYAFKYSVRYCALYKFRYTKKYKGKDRPYSYILSRNLYYNLLTNNCMQASVYYLKYGSLNKNNVEFKLQLGHVGVIPNNNINNFKKFGKWVTC
ncbi:RHS repeat domain-containing protein [Ruminococcus bromii]|uniref:RHS repeat domain-containing protein n=1 Tax=Ruminococcus bromii TaxID=40518 RepID=UPI0026ECD846|nr:RHS repeat-associated core domain-containing protein [Ruminococcus bromii]